jgi:hypothetical protein
MRLIRPRKPPSSVRVFTDITRLYPVSLWRGREILVNSDVTDQGYACTTCSGMCTAYRDGRRVCGGMEDILAVSRDWHEEEGERPVGVTTNGAFSQ